MEESKGTFRLVPRRRLPRGSSPPAPGAGGKAAKVLPRAPGVWGAALPVDEGVAFPWRPHSAEAGEPDLNVDASI